MKFYTNKTKPKCDLWVKALLKDYDGNIRIDDFFVVKKTKPYLEWCERHWNIIKDDVVCWQYADNFDKIIKKRLNIK